MKLIKLKQVIELTLCYKKALLSVWESKAFYIIMLIHIYFMCD